MPDAARNSSLRILGVCVGLTLLVSLNCPAQDADHVKNSDAAVAGADFDFAYGDLSRSNPSVSYGTLKLLAEGKLDALLWRANAKDPVPAMADIGRLSPTIEPQGKSVSTDSGRKVVSNPHAFSGSPEHVSGDWWVVEGGLCIQLQSQPAFSAQRVQFGHEQDWGAVYRSDDRQDSCTQAEAHRGRPLAAASTMAILSQRIYRRDKADFRVKYQVFDGVISRLNGWDAHCALSRWEKTELHFTPGVFESVGKNVWRAITMEHQPKSADMAVFAYLAIPETLTTVGRVVLMDVGHDFNRNGRIDDDWGHIYAGLPIISKAGDLGGMMLVDMSPVGIREIPYKGGCIGASGSQLTNTLGLILYLSRELSPDFGH